MPWPRPTFPGHHCGTDPSHSPACGGFSLPPAVGMALHCALNTNVLQFVQSRGSWHSCPPQGLGIRHSWAFPAQTKGGICPVLPAGSAHKPLPTNLCPARVWCPPTPGGCALGRGGRRGRDVLGKWRIRGKTFTFIPPVGRRVWNPLWQAGGQRLCQDLSAPHCHDGSTGNATLVPPPCLPWD